MKSTALLLVAIAACSPVKGKPLLDAEIITVDSVKVTPATVMLRHGLDTPAQLAAMATYSDGTSRDVTPDVVWASSQPATATVDGSGLVKAVSAGTATVTASLGSVQGMAAITIVEPTLAIGEISNPIGIDFFPAFSMGNVAPARSIRGPLTTLNFSWSMVPMPATDELYIASVSPAAIDVFPLDGGTACAMHTTAPICQADPACSFIGSICSANIAPTRQITGMTTGLGTAYGLAILNNEIYTVQNTNIISVFPQNGTGNIAPTRTITGAATLLNDSIGLAIHNNNLYVVNESGSIVVFPATATGNATPIQTISGSNTHLIAPIGVMFVGNEMYVSDPSASSIMVFPDDANGNVAPTRWLHGPDTTVADPIDMVKLAEQLVWVNLGNSSITEAPIEATSDTPPTRTISGAMTNISASRGLTVF